MIELKGHFLGYILLIFAILKICCGPLMKIKIIFQDPLFYLLSKYLFTKYLIYLVNKHPFNMINVNKCKAHDIPAQTLFDYKSVFHTYKLIMYPNMNIQAVVVLLYNVYYFVKKKHTF